MSRRDEAVMWHQRRQPQAGTLAAFEHGATPALFETTVDADWFTDYAATEEHALRLADHRLEPLAAPTIHHWTLIDRDSGDVRRILSVTTPARPA